MCGIAGIMTADGSPPSAETLARLSDALAHRGPDGEGRHQSGSVGLVHRRLAIIDLETGAQPIRVQGREREAAIVANGEIYNYRELWRLLEGVEFATRSDCEPPLHLYLRHGIDFADRLRGMYALAIHDAAAGRLVLARDPFGIKPLYFTQAGSGFAFASEPQALIRAGLATSETDAGVRDRILDYQYAAGRETAFRGIQRVLPGETLVIEGGRINGRRLRPALPSGGPRPMRAGDARILLDKILEESVDLHQRSDVPYGMFLSGGIDSSALLALMARLADRPVTAFTVGFPGASVPDEREHARAVAAAVGARHIEVTFTADDFHRLLPRVAAALDDPAADYAVLPTYKLGAAVREAGLKVVLSGEGGDELFAGYGRYRRALRPRVLGGRPMRAHGVLEGTGVLRESPAARRDPCEAGADDASWTPLQRLQAADCGGWLADDLLIKLDRCLMAHGVEGRVPFLDPGVADFAFRLPDRLKVRWGRGKWLLRRWLADALPAARPFSHKRGFTVPVADWIAADSQRLGPLVAAQPGIVEACRPDAVRALFANPRKKAGQASWMLLFHALWHQVNVLGRPVGEDIVSTLEQR